MTGIRGFLAPHRPRLAGALGAVTGLSDGAASAIRPAEIHVVLANLLGDGIAAEDSVTAWERLATHGVIPEGWVQDPQREFYDPPWLDRGVLTTPMGSRSLPPTTETAVALASDPAGVLAAEEIARVVARELGRSAAARAPVGWRVWPPTTLDRALFTPRIDDMHVRIHQRDAANALPRNASATRLALHNALRDLLATGYAVEMVSQAKIILACPGLDDRGPWSYP